MTAEDVMNRLDDLIVELRSNVEISLIPPPMSAVFERLQVMLQRGIIECHLDRLSDERSFTRVSNFKLGLQVRDIRTAFIGCPFHACIPGAAVGMMI